VPRVSTKTLKTLVLFAVLALAAGLIPGMNPWGGVDPLARALGLGPAAETAESAGEATPGAATDQGGGEAESDRELAAATEKLERLRTQVLDRDAEAAKAAAEAPAPAGAPAPATAPASAGAPAPAEGSTDGAAVPAERADSRAEVPTTLGAETGAAPAAPSAVEGAGAQAATTAAPAAAPVAAAATPEDKADATARAEAAAKADARIELTTAGYQPPSALDDPCIPYGSPTCPRRALDAFFKRLARTEAGDQGAITRVLHFGDSAIAGDDVTGTLRERFQTRFGNAGPGFVFIDKPWSWYARDGVRMASREGWKPSSLIFNRIDDGAYGLGGVAFQTVQKGISSRIELTSPLTSGPAHVELFYLGQPLGGTLRVTVGEEAPRDIDTVAPIPISGFRAFDSAGPIDRVVVETTSGKPLRLYGVVVEHGEHGVVWDSLGIVGARAIHMGNYDVTHLHEQVGRRDPGLIVLHFGLNEAQGEGLPGKRFRIAFKAVVDLVRLSAPRASCMIIGPTVVARLQGGVPVTKPIVPALSKAEQEVARECGCAFFDSLEALGGDANILVNRKPRLLSGDFTHLTRAGAEALGTALSDALLSAYDQRRPLQK